MFTRVNTPFWEWVDGSWCVFSPAVVQQVRWKDGNEDVLPVHGKEHSITRVHAGCKLNKHKIGAYSYIQ